MLTRRSSTHIKMARAIGSLCTTKGGPQLMALSVVLVAVIGLMQPASAARVRGRPTGNPTASPRRFQPQPDLLYSYLTSERPQYANDVGVYIGVFKDYEISSSPFEVSLVLQDDQGKLQKFLLSDGTTINGRPLRCLQVGRIRDRTVCEELTRWIVPGKTRFALLFWFANLQGFPIRATDEIVTLNGPEAHQARAYRAPLAPASSPTPSPPPMPRLPTGDDKALLSIILPHPGAEMKSVAIVGDYAEVVWQSGSRTGALLATDKYPGVWLPIDGETSAYAVRQIVARTKIPLAIAEQLVTQTCLQGVGACVFPSPPVQIPQNEPRS